jgi:hypothetical protein
MAMICRSGILTTITIRLIMILNRSVVGPLPMRNSIWVMSISVMQMWIQTMLKWSFKEGGECCFATLSSICVFRLFFTRSSIPSKKNRVYENYR